MRTGTVGMFLYVLDQVRAQHALQHAEMEKSIVNY